MLFVFFESILTFLLNFIEHKQPTRSVSREPYQLLIPKISLSDINAVPQIPETTAPAEIPETTASAEIPETTALAEIPDTL